MNEFQDHDDLIYDIGMNHGADAAFYCAKGFRVVSIEANPASVKIARQRHAALFESGRLHVMNVALAEEPGNLQFHVCNEESGKSTTSEKLVRHLKHVGFSFEIIEVPSRHIRNILEEWGVPYYMKIDVEGYDIELVRQLRDLGVKPRYISVEVDIYWFDTLSGLLNDMGYSEFQLVSQRGVPAQREPDPPVEGDAASPSFSLGNSGLFGKELPGSWISADAVRRQVTAIRTQHRTLRGMMKLKRNLPVDVGLTSLSRKILPKSHDWYDLHAR